MAGKKYILFYDINGKVLGADKYTTADDITRGGSGAVAAKFVSIPSDGNLQTFSSRKSTGSVLDISASTIGSRTQNLGFKIRNPETTAPNTLAPIGSFFHLKLDEGYGNYFEGEEVEQSYFKPISTKTHTGSPGPIYDHTDFKYDFSSLKFQGHESNVAGETGPIVYIDHNSVFGFTTGYVAGLSSANVTYFHTDFWIKPNASIKSDTLLFAKSTGTGLSSDGVEYGLFTNSTIAASTADSLSFKYAGNDGTDYSFTIEGTGANAVVGNGVTLEWHHIQIERAYTQFRVYVDGVLEAVDSIGTGEGVAGFTGDFVLGGYRDGFHSFNGNLDQFHIKLGPAGTTTDPGVLGRGWTGAGTYSELTRSVGATIDVPTSKALRDSYTALLIPCDGFSGSDMVVERGNHRVNGIVNFWNREEKLLFVDNIGITGSLITDTEPYFSTSYGWVFGFRGNQNIVRDLLLYSYVSGGSGGTLDNSGSLATWSMTGSSQLVGLSGAKEIAGDYTDFMSELQKTKSISGSVSAPNVFPVTFAPGISLGLPTGSGGNGYFEEITIVPTNDFVEYITNIVTYNTAGGTPEAYYPIPNALGTNYNLPYSQVEDVYTDVTNYINVVNGVKDESISELNSKTKLREIRTKETQGDGSSHITVFSTNFVSSALASGDYTPIDDGGLGVGGF